MNSLRNAFFIVSLSAVSAAATADTLDLQFDVSATVPSNDFYVNARGGWNNNTQIMNWNTSTLKLDAVTNPVEIKGYANSVDVYLAGTPRLGSGASTIPLTVRLDASNVPVGSADPLKLTNANGREYALIVSPAAGVTYTPGSYSGTVEMVFDSVAP